MKEYIVQDDRTTGLLCTMLYLLLSGVLLLCSIYAYRIGYFLLAFLGITGIWFSVKVACRYGSRWLHHTPVCEFQTDGIVFPAMPRAAQTMSYRDIKRIRILQSTHSVKLFLSGDTVSHPSGWNYTNVRYIFHTEKLSEATQHMLDCIQRHHIPYEIIQEHKHHMIGGIRCKK